MMMKTHKKMKFIAVIFMSVIFSAFFSCDDELTNDAFDQEDTLALTISNDDLVLEELFFTNTINFDWTTGTNQDTGAAIKYTLEMDMASGDFSTPMATLFSGVQSTYRYEMTYGDLNNMLLDNGLNPNESYQLSMKVTATIADASVAQQTAMTNFAVTTFKPITSRLFMVGDATPNGWDISNATELVSSTNTRGVFIYEGDLTPGNFKFAVNQDGCFCQDFYTKDAADGTSMVYNQGGSGDDLQWTIDQELGPDEDYRITADLLNLTITIEIVESVVDTPPFSTLWIVGDATESGWNIDAPAAFNQDGENPFLFNYEGQFNPGNFKIFAGPLGDFCGEWYRPFTNNELMVNGPVNQNSGCDSDTNWLVTEQTKGRYKVVLDTENNTVSFNKIALYIIGDGGPNGWNISTPTPMTYTNGEYVYTGPLGANNPTGEFKISKFKGDWCNGDWINPATNGQSINNTNFMYTYACDGPDNKWKLQTGQAGNYVIRINLETEQMTITPQ
ncbi:uncharacterized protein DUF5019 [Gelidibacter algens]|uniref:Uncharacterized protein DUF5019 n=3 Tax=Gelidibacter algens TaxID=49280 RepID=A0A327SIE5_9FLAO|nr:uncharacterized protein DUF5019 [Gelidibacter algens]